MSNEPGLIHEFVHYLRYERHFSHYTARCYEADLRQYRPVAANRRVGAARKGRHQPRNGSYG